MAHAPDKRVVSGKHATGVDDRDGCNRNRGRHMIRKLLLPLVAVALLGGCMTSYSYRQGSGDYYHGAPSVEYRYHAPYGAYGYGYPYGYYGRSVYDYRYDSPYRYRQYYTVPYRNRYYGYPYRHPNRTYRRPTVDPTPDRTRSPWRDLDRLRRRGVDGGDDSTQAPISTPRTEGDTNIARRRRPAPVDTRDVMRPRAPTPQPPPYSRPAPRGDSSAIGGMVRRAGRKGDQADENNP